MRHPLLFLIALTLPTSVNATDASASGAPLQGIDESPLGEILQGFDDPPSSLESVIDGFDSPIQDLDAVIDGFDSSTQNMLAHSPQRPPSRLTIDGDVSLSAAWNTAHDAPSAGSTDWRGLSRLRGKLNLAFDYDLGAGWELEMGGRALYDAVYVVNGRDDYLASLVDSSESELELHEAYLQGSLTNAVDLKLGRQIVVWGKSDNLRLTDVINPMDTRELGMVDIEDLRLPTGMARLDAYTGDWSISALIIPEVRFNKEPAFGSDFYPMPLPLPNNQRPGSGGDATEYALAINGIFSGWDLALYRAWVFDDQSTLYMTPGGPERRHARIQMSGIAANWAIGSWLLKSELAHFDGLRITGQSTAKSQNGLLLGVEYVGFHETTLSLESVVRRWAESYPGGERDNYQSALRANRTLLHDRLTLTLIRLAMGANFEQGGFTRLSAEYDLADGINLSGGYIDYQQGSLIPFTTIADNDRLFVELRYSF